MKLPPLTDWKTTNTETIALKPGSSVTSTVSLTVPAGVWGSSTIPMSCKLEGQEWQLSGLGTIRLTSANKINQWMVAGPFSSAHIAEWPPIGWNERQKVVLDTLYPPEHLKDLNINSRYKGAGGMVHWKPVTEENLDFTRLYGPVSNGVAYAMTVLRVTQPTRIAITTSGTFSTMIYLDGEILGLPYHRWGHELLSRTLDKGDHILLCCVPQNINPKTKIINPWQLSVQVDVNPGSTPGTIRIVPVK